MSGVGITLASALSQIHNLFLADFAGTEWILGAFTLIVVLMWMKNVGNTAVSILATGFAGLALYLTWYGYLPSWLGFIVVMILMLSLYTAVKSYLYSK